MPRRPRFPLTGYPLHVVQRGNDRKRCFFGHADFRFYLDALQIAAAHYRVQVHAYALMTNHVHLLLTPLGPGTVSRVMQSVGARYVRYVNDTHGRTGTLWEGRYRACLVGEDTYVLAACRYIDLNPVRAGLVPLPSEWPWSSYAGLAGLRADPLLTPHPALESLGAPRGLAYARWCAGPGDEPAITELRRATQGELAFASDALKLRINAATNRATTFGRRQPLGPAGRPA
jgi:putative transposase